MSFRFGMVSRPATTAGGLVVFVIFAIAVVAQTPNWKDRQEYDLFVKMSQTPDPNGRLELLNSWQAKYPQSDVSALRLKYYVATLAILAQTTPGERPPLLEKCQDLLKFDSNDVNALYEISLWGPVVGGVSPPSDLLKEVDSAAKGFIAGADAAFAPANRPSEISAADFVKAKSLRLSVAHNALAWAAVVKKDLPAADSEYKASLTSNPEQGATAAQYAKFLYDQKRYPEALFEYARAAQYTGPGPALPPATRSQLSDFFKTAYKEFHGAPDGADQVLAQARTSSLPPATLSIVSAVDAAKKEDEELKARIASDPGFGLWYTIRQNLTEDQGDSFFDRTVKNASIPGGAQGITSFSGTVISLDSSARPTTVLVGVDDPAKADAALEFSKPLPVAALDKLKAGEIVKFSGVVTDYNKDPYRLTFKEPAILGVPTNRVARSAH